MHALAACAIFKDEAPYLDDWLRFHAGVGVQHFYLYDNGSTDAFQPVLDPWLASGRATLHDWPERPGQLAAYRHCLATHRRAARWIAFIDIDEFLFSPLQAQLPDALAPFAQHPAVGANWVVFGSGGHATRPPDPAPLAYRFRASFGLRLAKPEYLRAGGDPRDSADYLPYSCHVKSVVNPAAVVDILSPHSFRYAGEQPAVDENLNPIAGTFNNALTQSVSATRLRVHHYWSRSRAELRGKIARGDVLDRAQSLDQSLRFETRLNAVEDLTIVPLAGRILGPASRP